MTTQASTTSGVPKTREQLVIEALLPITRQFTYELNESLRTHATTFHRLHIRIKDGYIDLCRTEGGKDHDVTEFKGKLDEGKESI